MRSGRSIFRRDKKVTDPDALLIIKQQKQEHWTVEEVLQVQDWWTAEELTQNGISVFLTEGNEEDFGDIKAMSELCSADTLSDACPPCIATYLLNSDGPPPPPQEDDEEPDPEALQRLRKTLETPAPWEQALGVGEPQQDVLNSLEELRSNVIRLFDTGRALGPVNREELADLVFAAGQWISSLAAVEVLGGALSDEQQALRNRVEVVVKRVNGE